MRLEMSKLMFRTNTEEGIKRFLSSKGFDLDREIRYEDGPTKKTVYAVQDEILDDARHKIIETRLKTKAKRKPKVKAK